MSAFLPVELVRGDPDLAQLHQFLYHFFVNLLSEFVHWGRPFPWFLPRSLRLAAVSFLG